MLTRLGVIAAVIVIIYCMFKLRTCKDTYAELDYDAYYEEQAAAQDIQDIELEEDKYEEDNEDYYEEGDGGDEAPEEGEYANYEGPVGNDPYDNYTLMESTMDDTQTNALFEAGM